MSHKLENYLRTYRKQSGLSQDEVAFLLGCQTGTKVSRYERFARKPSLETLFAYEVVFGAPAQAFCRCLSKGRKENIESGSASDPETKPSNADSYGGSKASNFRSDYFRVRN